MNIRLEAAKDMRAESETSIGALRRSVAGRLRKGGIESAESEARLFLSHALGIDDAAILAEPKTEVREDVQRWLEDFLARRLAGEPMARIVGRKEFWSRSFRLGPDTLVPRPETETVVEAALAAFPDRNAALRVLDLGTGAGILLAALLAERTRSFGLGIDRSEGALAVARANLEALGLGPRAVLRVWATGVRRWAESSILSSATRPILPRMNFAAFELKCVLTTRVLRSMAAPMAWMLIAPSFRILPDCFTRMVLRFSSWDAGRNTRSQIWRVMQGSPLPVPPAPISPESRGR